MIIQRIIHVVDSMNPKLGGVSQAVNTIITGLDKLDVQNEAVCLDSPDADYLKNYSFPIHALGPSVTPWSYSSKLIPWLRTKLCASDLVIVHGIWLFSSFAVRKAAWKFSRQTATITEVPFFIMPHGMLDPYFQRATIRRLKAVRNWVYWKLIESKVVNEANGLLFTCNVELQLARQAFSPYRPKREINVGYGMQAPPPFTSSMQAAFQEKCPGLHEQPYLLFLSRINYKKGVNLLIQAYSMLIKNSTNASIQLPKLVIAGPGINTKYGQTILQLLTETGIPDDMIFLPGMLAGEAKWGAFYGSDAFILPSHQENFGIAVVEALACRKPVLISNKVNIHQEIVESGAGFVAPDTLTGTINLLVRWLGLPSDEKLKMSVCAQETFEKQFAIGPAAERLLNAVIKH